MISIDGKTIRQSFDRDRQQKAIHVVSAWASTHRLVLGQLSVYGGQKAVMSLTERGVVQIPFRLEEEVDRVWELLNHYQSVPMSLADA